MPTDVAGMNSERMRRVLEMNQWQAVPPLEMMPELPEKKLTVWSISLKGKAY